MPRGKNRRNGSKRMVRINAFLFPTVFFAAPA
jgi:hypothetical protein